MIDLSLLLALSVGLLLSSVLNRVIIRLPLERGLGGWLHCTRCARPLAWWQFIPIVGWAAQRGRASCCGKPLHWVHPLIDLIGTLSICWLYLRYGLSPLFFYLTIVAVVLLVTGAIDWLHRWIFTYIVLGGAAIVLSASPFVRPHNLMNALLGLIVAGFIFALFFFLARILFPAHGAPFGLGDVYLAMFLGAAFGITRLGPVLFAGMLLAGIFSIGVIVLRALGRSTPTYISYGTFLCIGALGVLLLRGLS